jgi:Putative DNA-binding domain
MQNGLNDQYERLMTLADVSRLFVEAGAPESNYLEFKQKHDRSNAALDQGDRTQFSKAVSAFSNSAGGLLVWGIETRRVASTDVAIGIRPITDAEEFAERLRTSLLDTTMPFNKGVRMKALNDSVGAGVVVCLVPESDHGPLRAMKAEREYWVRMDGRSARMEHYQIRDMMMRRALPNLELGVLHDRTDQPEGHIKVRFTLSNTGTAIAKHLAAFIEVLDGNITAVDGLHDVSALNGGLQMASYIGQTSVLHPVDIALSLGSMIVVPTTDSGKVTFKIKWYCEGMTAKTQDYTAFNDEDGSGGENG